jgi:putative peptidoglycan lipid II flippase
MPSQEGKVKQKQRSRGLLASVLTVGSITVASRVFGLLRDVVIARMLGAGVGADAFFVAFRIPNFLRRLFAEGAFSQAFVPVLAEYRTRKEHADAQDLIAHTAGMLGAVLLLVTALGMLTAPFVIAMFAPGFDTGDGHKLALAGDMLRITFPYLLFISLAALAGGALNTYERFGVPAFTPVLLNVSMICCSIWLAPHLDEPALALAWGVAIGGAMQLAFQLPFLRRLNLLVWPRLRRGHVGVARVMRLMLPAVFGASVSQVNLLVNTLLASFLVTGSVSWLYFADRLLEFPLGVFGVALGTVMLPRLSAQHSASEPERFTATLDWSLRLAALIAIPAAVALWVLSAHLLATLFQYGAFRPSDVRMAALALDAYAIGLSAFVAVKVLAPAYFAQQDTKTPVRYGVVAVLANIAFSAMLVGPLAHVGLALAISLATMVNATLLYRGLRRSGVYKPSPGWLRYIGVLTLAGALMGAVLFWVSGPIELWFSYGVWERAGRTALLVALGMASYALVLLVFGIRPKALSAPNFTTPS